MMKLLTEKLKRQDLERFWNEDEKWRAIASTEPGELRR